MSLYQEALVEARKLKEIAEADAKKAIVEEITPHIRKMIASTLAGKSANLLFEEEERLPAEVPDASIAPDTAAATPTADAAAAPPPSLEPSAGAMAPPGAQGPSDAPIQVPDADSLKLPMPGSDGMLIVTFDDMFQPKSPEEMSSPDDGVGSAEMEPEIPGGMPSSEPVDANPTTPTGTAPETGMVNPEMPVEPEAEVPPVPEPQMETFELFSESLDATSKKINSVYSTKKISSLVKEALQDKVFSLFETLTGMTAKGQISENMSKIFESRLEIMHMKLQEADLNNTYQGIKGTEMAKKSLKEFASKLLESDSIKGGPVTSPADPHKTQVTMDVTNANDAAADRAAAHAKKLTEPTVTLKTEAAELDKLEEELKALISEDEGESLVAKEGEQNLAGAASTIPDKKVGQVDTTKTPAGGPSNPASYVQGVSETVSVDAKALNERTKDLKAESLRKQIAALQEQLKECGMSEEGVMDEEPLAEDGGPNLIVKIDLGSLLGNEFNGLKDDDEVEIVDDEPGSEVDLGSDEPEDDFASAEDPGDMDIDVADVDSPEPSEEEDVDMDLASDEPSDEEMPLTERVVRARKVSARTLKENQALKAQLAEQTLFNAKVVHLQPFLNNGNLTKEQKQKIVEYLDRGRTVNEVKTIYTRVKTVLETVQKAKAKVGSASKPAGAGAATLNESVNNIENLYEGAVLVESERNRLMELAGIRRK